MRTWYVGRVVLVSAAVALISATPALETLAPLSAQSSPVRYYLDAQWSVPDAPITWPDDPIAIDIALYQRELFVVDGSAALVRVLAPDGGQLRSFGETTLQEPLDVGVVQSGGDWVAEDARVFVVDGADASLYIFSLDGALIRRVEGFEDPVAVAGGARGRAYVADRSKERITVLDFDGTTIDSWGGDGTTLGAIGRPVALVAEEDVRIPSHVVVANEAGEIIWVSPDGERRATRLLELGQSRLTPRDLALLDHRAHSTVYAATDRGIVKVDAYHSRMELLRPPSGEAVAINVIDAFKTLENDWVATDWSTIYAAAEEDGELVRHFHHRGEKLERTCPWADEQIVSPWRIALGQDDEVMVATSAGTLYQFSKDGLASRVTEIGDIDDFVPLDAGAYAVISRNHLLIVDNDRVTHPMNHLLSWRNEYDCTPAGFGLHGSIARNGDSRALELSLVGSFIGWLSLGAGSLQRRVAVPTDGPPAEAYNLYWPQPDAAQLPHLISDVAIDERGELAFAVDRLVGLVYPVHSNVPNVNVTVGAAIPVPGGPLRAVHGPNETLFVLTHEGFVWKLSSAGELLGGWDAGRALDGATELVDIEVDDAGTVFILDRPSNSVLVFKEFTGQADPLPKPELPDPCTIERNKTAQQDVVRVSEPVTVELRISGACGRHSSTNDILLLLRPSHSWWAKENYRLAAEHFLDAVDGRQDRVAVMTMDASGRLIVPFTDDIAAVQAALPEVLTVPGTHSRDVQPLDTARIYMQENARPGANKIILAVSELPPGQYDNVIAGERLRKAGIRTIVVMNDILWGFIGASVALSPDDVHFAPDTSTMRAVYEQLGKAISARVLARELKVTDRLPANMEYVPGSASPPARWDDQQRTLHWDALSVGFDGWSASFVVRPSEVGRWPTNIDARADYVDGLGNPGRTSFPLPWIEVLPAPTATPTASIAPSPTPGPSVTSTATAIAAPPTVAAQVYLPVLVREKPCIVEQSMVDIVLVIDRSTSMQGEKLDATKTAAVVFVETTRETHDRVAIVAMDAEASVLVPLTNRRDVIRSVIDLIDVGAGTRIDRGLTAAVEELGSSGARDDADKVIILLTDGRQDDEPESAHAIAAQARDDGIVIYAIGLGDDVDKPFLEKLAGRVDRYIFAPEPDELVGIYKALAREVPCPASRYWGGR